MNPAYTLLQNRSVGWALDCDSHKNNRNTKQHAHYKSCRGIFQCRSCVFKARPQGAPKKKAAKEANGSKEEEDDEMNESPIEDISSLAIICEGGHGANEESTKKKKPKAPPVTKKVCKIHKDLPLIWIPCKATLKTVTDSSDRTVTFIHTGKHNHAKPSPCRFSGSSMQVFKLRVQAAPRTLPKQHQMDSDTLSGIGDIHPAGNNLGYITGLRSKFLKEAKVVGSGYGAISTMEQKMEKEFVRKSGVAAKDGHICIQTDFIRDRVPELLQNGLQTDSVHGIVSEPEFNDMNVTFTTARCPLLGRTFPVLISILSGKSAHHYERHFVALFESFPYKTYSDFESNFPGMTCDLAESLQVGFEQAIKKYYGLPPEQEVFLERFYRHCKVHYKRNITRVWRKLPKASRDRFRSKAKRLTRRCLTREEFSALKDSLLKEYPTARNWIKWHTDERRGKFMYPAMATRDNSHIGKDTNAQEGLGNDYKTLAPKSVMSTPEAIAHTVEYMGRFQKDYEWEIKDGGQGRYKRQKQTKPKTNQPYVNDGVPPESSDESSSEEAKKKTRSKKRQANTKVSPPGKKQIGRPFGGKDRVPKLGSGEGIDWATFGIPWSFEWNGMEETNTCALDTAFMTVFLIIKFTGAILLSCVSETENGRILREVYDLLCEGRYNEARYRWCLEVLNGDRSCHFRSIEEVFHNKVPGLTRIGTETATTCSSSCCPHARQTKQRFPESIVAQGFNINQDELDRLLIRTTIDCSERMTPSQVADSKEGAYKIASEYNADTGKIEEFFTCTGRRTADKTQVTAPPYVLIIDYVQITLEKGRWDITKPITLPTRSLTLGGVEYHLAALIYSNGYHFNCSVFIGDKILFYDGKPARKNMNLTKWLNSERPQHPSGYYLAYAWFTRASKINQVDTIQNSPADESAASALLSMPRKRARNPSYEAVQIPLQEAPAPSPLPCLKPKNTQLSMRSSRSKTKATSVSFSVPEDSITTSSSTPRRTRSNRSHTHQERTRILHVDGPIYPYGLCLSNVKQRGAQPKCQGCQEHMERGTTRFVVKVVTNPTRGYSRTESYHLLRRCVASMPETFFRDASLHLRTV